MFDALQLDLLRKLPKATWRPYVQVDEMPTWHYTAVSQSPKFIEMAVNVLGHFFEDSGRIVSLDQGTSTNPETRFARIGALLNVLFKEHMVPSILPIEFLVELYEGTCSATVRFESDLIAPISSGILQQNFELAAENHAIVRGLFSAMHKLGFEYDYSESQAYGVVAGGFSSDFEHYKDSLIAAYSGCDPFSGSDVFRFCLSDAEIESTLSGVERAAEVAARVLEIQRIASDRAVFGRASDLLTLGVRIVGDSDQLPVFGPHRLHDDDRSLSSFRAAVGIEELRNAAEDRAKVDEDFKRLMSSLARMRLSEVLYWHLLAPAMFSDFESREAVELWSQGGALTLDRNSRLHVWMQGPD